MASDRLRRVTILTDAGQEVNAIAAVVAALGARATQIELADDLDVLAPLAKQRPDLVVNLCERFARDPQRAPDVPAALDLLRLHYTGAGAAALHMGNDLDLARRVLASHGVPVTREEDTAGEGAWIAVIGNGEDREVFAVPPTTAEAARAVSELIEPVWEVLRLRDYALLGARIAGGEARLSLVVPNPPLDPDGELAAAAHRGGWSYERLIRRILSEAWDRRQEDRRPAENLLA